MIPVAELGMMMLDSMSADELREKLAVGLQQETEEQRQGIRGIMCNAMCMGGDVDKVQVVLESLEAACKEVLVPSSRDDHSLLWFALYRQKRGIVMAVVERMRKEGLRQTNLSPLGQLIQWRSVEEDVADAVAGVMDRSVTSVMMNHTDALFRAIDSLRERRAFAVNWVLKHWPTMAERQQAGQAVFRYIHFAARKSDLKTLQQIHEVLPVLPDGAGRRGELADYAQAIDVAAFSGSDAEAHLKIAHLAEQAGDEVFDLCSPTILLTTQSQAAMEVLVDRAPQLVEAACKQPNCLALLVDESKKLTLLVERMAELVDPKVLCGLMRQSPPRAWWVGSRGWRSMLKPVHEAVPECMDGLRWSWLMQAVQDEAYEDVEYMLGMCTREHLVMRNEAGDTAYDVAAMDVEFPQDLKERLKVMAKGAHA